MANKSSDTAFIWYIFEEIKEKQKSSVIVVDDDEDVERIFAICESINKVFKLCVEILRFDLLKDNQARTIENLYKSSLLKIIIASKKSIDIAFSAKDNFKAFNIKVGSSYLRDKIISKLIEVGFNKVNFVENQGEFATRGSVIDIFNFGDDYPVRIYFDLNTVSAIRRFEIDTQNTFDFEMEFDVKNLKSKDVRLSDFEFENYFLDIDSVSFLEKMDFFLNIKYISLDAFIKDLKKFIDKSYDIYLFCLNEREVSKVISIFEEYKIKYPLKFVEGYISYGFYSPSKKIFVVSSSEIFLREYEYTRFSNKTKKYFKINDLYIGDFVVHQDFGIARYGGIKEIIHRDEWGNVYKSECILLEYSGGDKLYISLDDFKKISKYVGSENSRVKLSSLSQTTWKKIKERVKKEVENVAKDIIKIEARRKTIRINPMIKNNFEDDFELDFEYEYTPDQKTAINDVLKDLESGYVTTRIIVGDVGFGKTEVAMRACMRAVLNGFQCALICPTTILAEQHYINFSKRFSKYAINIERLNRLVCVNEKKQIIENISKGIIDIIIGTHILLLENIKFKNIGLLIIDEEHKFGVKQKEEIKKRYPDIHVLYLSATPIPRTLYQSLSDIIKMSVIETPPQGRLSVNTEVLPYNKNTIVDAVNFELKRGGQIYYVYNRVEFIERKKNELEKLLPGIKIAVIHGQMRSIEIENIMLNFMNKKYDILLASTIIESGIDIPSVNTLIVEDSHKMGLSQLYQLRGRVGREKKKAYCYFFYPSNITEDESSNSGTLKRLFALREFSELGSGFRLAMRDLEIRGAGEILGLKQHGFINAVGLDMYLNLLEREIKRIKGIEVKEDEDVLIDLKISAFIPPSYINDDMERLNFYKRLYSASLNEIDDIISKMIDIAGPIPDETKNLYEIIKIKRKAKDMGVKKIIEKNKYIEFYFSKDFKILEKDLKRWQNEFRDMIRFFKTSAGDGFEVYINTSNKIDLIKKVLNI